MRFRKRVLILIDRLSFSVLTLIKNPKDDFVHKNDYDSLINTISLMKIKCCCGFIIKMTINAIYFYEIVKS